MHDQRLTSFSSYYGHHEQGTNIFVIRATQPIRQETLNYDVRIPVGPLKGGSETPSFNALPHIFQKRDIFG